MSSVGTLEGNYVIPKPSGIVVPLRDDRLLSALSSASRIRTHLDYYRWLQTEIKNFMPHTSLLAAWGNFETRELQIDLASSLEGETTRTLEQVTGLEQILAGLFERVRGSGRSWLVARSFHDEAIAHDVDVQADFYRRHAAAHSMLLVYVMHCERVDQDCLYVFSVTEERLHVSPRLLDLVMPHIDSALRRVKCLPPSHSAATGVHSLSDREHEVLNWVSQGKSNEEIGRILGITRNTVKNHLKRIFAKMGVTARSQAVRVYLEKRL